MWVAGSLLQKWLIAFFTIALLSVAFKDNPVYRFTEHLYVGLFAGYNVMMNWFNYGKPTIYTRILKDGQWTYVIPIIIGLIIYTRYIKSIAWMSRYTISFLLGMGAGYVLTKDFKSLFLDQVTATFVNLGNLDSLLLAVGVVCTIVYFFFTVERKGVVGYVGQAGKWVMMIAFGSAFGNTVMARVSLFLGRLQFLLIDFLKVAK
ncbi:MAG: hypothetical protein Q8P50_16915 [Bacillota bacterium]|nr:hypothetical protein [Bacillota bacterium]